MGFIQAFKGAIGGTLADQWKDFIVPTNLVTQTSVIFGGVMSGTNAGRGANTKGSEAIISNGSKIVVPEGTALITMQEGAITGCIMEPGGYEFHSDDINSQSIFAGDDMLSSLITQSWERFKFGGQPGSQHKAIYVNLKEIPGNRFGTQSEIYWDDAYLGAQVGAITRGTYSIKVVDPILLVKNFIPVSSLVSSVPVFDLSDMDNPLGEQLFNEVVGTLSAAFSMYTNDPSKGNRMSKIQSDQIGFASSLSQAVENAYAWRSGRGLVIERVAIAAIEYDADTKELLSNVKKADALSGARADVFAKVTIAESMKDAANNTSGNGGAMGMAFMGMGMQGANAAMGGMQSTNEATPQSQFIQQQAEQNKQNAAPQEDPYERLAKLKGLLDQGVISQEEFDAAKAQLLGL